MNFVIAGLLFLLSGVAGLIYEVIWFRMLGTTFGATGPALAATTAAFMGGLGIGSQLMSRRADRVQRPLRWYAGLEVLIAATAFVLPWMIRSAESIQLQMFGSAESSLLRDSSQFLIAFFILVIPTALMGATLPVLSRVVVEQDQHLGRRFTWLYGMNTLGAALGALASGFYLIPEFGVRNTMFTAMGLNIAAAVGAVLFARRNSSKSSRAETNDTADSDALPHARLITTAAFVMGFVSLAAQYHWTRGLVFAFDRLKNTTYSFSIVLGITLVGLVLGTLLIYFVIDRFRNPRVALGTLTVLLGLSIATSVMVLLWAPKLVDVIDPKTLRIDFVLAVKQVAIRTIAVLGLPTVLMGAAFPVAVKCIARDSSVGDGVGRLYAWNTWGSVLGATAAGFLLTPLFGLTRGLILLGTLDIAVGALLLFPRRKSIAAATMAAGMLAMIVSLQTNSHAWALQSLRDDETIVRYRDGAAATVCVIESKNGERRICVDDVPVAGTSGIMQTDQKSLAHWGMLLAKNPRRALTVGFGSGGASWSFLLHDRLENLDAVEICKDVPAFADLMTDANHGLLENKDPRYRIVFADARAYLRSTEYRYDAIVSDCTDLRYRSSANLYDLEYFQLCHDALNDGGCTVIWMPLGGLSEDAFRLTLRTFAAVYEDAGVYYLHNQWTHYVLLVGHRGQHKLQIDTVKKMLEEDDVRTDMAEIGMTDPYKVVATYLTGGFKLKQYLAGEELNTENNPYLEFAVPKHDTGPWSAQQNLNALARRKDSLSTILAADTPPAERQMCERYSQAAAWILVAQAAEQQTQVEEATQAYLRAQNETPDDTAIKRALEFPALLTHVADKQPVACLLMGRSLQLQGHPKRALNYFEKYEELVKEMQNATLDREKKQQLDQALAWKATASMWLDEAKKNRK